MKPVKIFAGLLWLLLSVSVAIAGANPADTRFDALRERLVKDGFDRPWIDGIYKSPEVQFDTNSTTLYFRHRESRLDYNQFATAESIEKAKKYMAAHADALARAEKKYGVQAEVITAILLVETRLGTYVGKRSTVSILSSLASLTEPSVRDGVWKEMTRPRTMGRKQFDRWARDKSLWAYRELKAFLTYVERENLDPAGIYGSYAGALGIAQFMPTSVLDYARDGNADGQINLFHHEDAIASVGYFLKRYGWKPGIDRARATKIIFRYNHSTYYVNAILKISRLLGG
jgi:membrane-bound lytic murein transglycosylase B